MPLSAQEREYLNTALGAIQADLEAHKVLLRGRLPPEGADHYADEVKYRIELILAHALDRLKAAATR